MLFFNAKSHHRGIAPQASVRRVPKGDSAAVLKWIQSVREIHAAAPAPSVQYAGLVRKF